MSRTVPDLPTAVKDDLLHLEGVTRIVPARRFHQVFAESTIADTLYYLESGMVKVFKRSPDGKEIILRLIFPGEIFGEQALGSEKPRGFAADMIQDGAVIGIPREAFIHYCVANASVWLTVAELLAVRQRQLEKKIEMLSLHDVEHRILYYLMDLAQQMGAAPGPEEVSIPLSQGELASLIGATRETTSTTLNTLARRGVIRLGRRLIILPSLDAMSAVVGAPVAKAAGRS
ncbi:MAG TPA: Crp/Fnr family transcriptional regulator [Bryobacteraceae bacterium]|nr:Crp/Fnr family transcriptional regulator [Bryobacteraceae bacterium]